MAKQALVRGVPKQTIPSSSPALSPEAAKFMAAPPVQRVQELYKSESERVGAIDPDPKATEARLREVAAALRPEEFDWLRDQALNPKENADARFFATYLVALSGQAGSLSALRAIVISPLPKTKIEAQLDLERQIRAQGMEGLSRMCREPGARDALLEGEQAHADEFLRDRAHRNLYAYHNCSDVTEADRAALDKKLSGEGR